MTQKQKDQGKGLLYTLLIVQAMQLWLALLIARQFEISFWRAYRYTAIGQYAVFFIGRNWQQGIVSYTKFREDLEDWTENYQAWAEKEKARRDAEKKNPPAATQRHAA